MRMRKVFAGIAALATLLGGLAVGASAAQATPTNLGNTAVKGTPGTITVINAQEGHTYSAYQFATFSNVKGEGDTVTSMDVATSSKEGSSNTNWAYLLRDAYNTAARQSGSTLQQGALDEKTSYYDNPAAYLATLSGDQMAEVVSHLNESLVKNNYSPDASGTNGSKVPIDLTLQNPQQSLNGWYIVFDKQGQNAFHPAVVATQISDGTTTYTKFNLSESKNQTSIQDALGLYYAKNENVPDKPDKMVKDSNGNSINDGSVNVGDTLNYSVQSAVSKNAANFVGAYTYKIMDQASRGLDVNGTSVKIVYSDTLEVPTDAQTIPSEQYDVDKTIDQATGTTTLLVTFNDVSAYAGKYLTMTYSAKVTEGAVSAGSYAYTDKDGNHTVDIAAGNVKNQVRVSHNGGAWTEPGERNNYTGTFSFQKYGVNAGANGLNGVEFQIYNGKTAGDTPLRFTGSNGVYTLNPTSGNSTVVSGTHDGKEGMVVLQGLKEGAYTVKEIKTVDGYTQKILATFSVKLTVDAQGVSTVSLLQDANNGLGLASTDNGSIRVKNVQNVAQLPLTGAAGITLFAVIAVLFAAVAAVLIVKFRSARRELEA